jgi:hypothetical protein
MSLGKLGTSAPQPGPALKNQSFAQHFPYNLGHFSTRVRLALAPPVLSQFGFAAPIRAILRMKGFLDTTSAPIGHSRSSMSAHQIAKRL